MIVELLVKSSNIQEYPNSQQGMSNIQVVGHQASKEEKQ
jgi:hypothetical protein